MSRMMDKKSHKTKEEDMVQAKTNREEYMPKLEVIENELARVENLDDFFGKEGVFARLFSKTIEAMLEGS